MKEWKWEKGMDGKPPLCYLVNNKWDFVKYRFIDGVFKDRIVIQAGSDHGLMHFKDAYTGEYLGFAGIIYFELNTMRIS